MKSSREIEATLCITKKDFEFEAVTNLLELEPTEKWVQKYDQLKNTELDYKSWNLSTGVFDNDSISEVVEELLKKIDEKEDKIRTLVETGFSISVVCVVKVWTDKPIYELSKGVISKLADIYAEFSIDILDFSE